MPLTDSHPKFQPNRGPGEPGPDGRPVYTIQIVEGMTENIFPMLNLKASQLCDENTDPDNCSVTVFLRRTVDDTKSPIFCPGTPVPPFSVHQLTVLEETAECGAEIPDQTTLLRLLGGSDGLVDSPWMANYRLILVVNDNGAISTADVGLLEVEITGGNDIRHCKVFGGRRYRTDFTG